MAILGGAVLVAMVVVLPSGRAIAGNHAGVLAGLTAAGVCLAAAWIALALCEPLRKQRQPTAMVLVGMTVRMAIPLAAAVVGHFVGGPLADAGFLVYLIVFYLVTLAVETALTLPSSSQTDAADSVREQEKAG